MRCESCGAEVLLGSASCGACGRSLLGGGTTSGITVTDVGPAAPEPTIPPPPVEEPTAFDAPPPPPPGWTLADGPGRQNLLPPPPTALTTLSSALGQPKDKKGCGCGVVVFLGVAVVVAAIIGVVVAIAAQVRGDRLEGPDLALNETVRFEIGSNDTGVHRLPLGEGAVTITVRGIDDDFDPKLKVVDADGTVLGENDDALGLDSQLSFTFPSGADVVVEVTEFGSDAGRYEVEVSSGLEGPAIDPTDVVAGERIEVGELPVAEEVRGRLGADDVDVHHLAGFEGRVSITVLGVDGFDPVLRVVAADGTVLGENDDFDGRDSFLTFVLSTSDELDIEVREFSGDAGAYAIRLDRGDASQGTVAIGDPLTAGQSVSGRVSEHQVIRHDFLGEGGTVRVDVVGFEGFDPMVRVLAPNGDLLAQDDDGGEGRNARVEVALPASSAVTVEVLGFNEQGGAYAVTVEA